jgi:glycosyltransferase involved in cell wall biosynthesis
VHLYKNYGQELDIYVEEMPYYRAEWEQAKKMVYKEEYNSILAGLKQWQGEHVDIVYSITFPYDITPIVINSRDVPKCVFYTSEFSWLDEGYFSMYGKSPNIHELEQCVKTHKDMHFTSPSAWSSKGMKKFVSESRNRTITHGVDETIFKLHENNVKREAIRRFYGVSETDILMINIGAMTQNKGLMLILQALNVLVNEHGKTNYKLLLKGTGDLYSSKGFLEKYFEDLQAAKLMSKAQVDRLLKDNIIFTDKTMSYTKINDLFNAADVYVSPYIAEGFNLTVLEALAAGLPVIVPQTGSTKEYIEDITNNGGKAYIMYVESKVAMFQNGMMQNMIEPVALIKVLADHEEQITNMKRERMTKYREMRDYITKEYSWNKVSDLLYEYLRDIVASARS